MPEEHKAHAKHEEHKVHAKKETGLIAALEPTFTKNAPWQMPEEWRKGLVKWLPWVNLILGVLLLPGALALIGLMGLVNTAAVAVGYNGSPLGMLAGVVLIVSIALLIVTFPGMRKQQLSTWKILFWAYIIYFIYDVVNVIAGGLTAMPIFNLIWSAIGTAIGLFVLFQIKHYYK